MAVIPGPITPFAQSDLLAMMDRILPHTYLDPLKSPGPGYEILQAFANEFARISQGVATLGLDAQISTAGGGIYATGFVELFRASIPSIGLDLPGQTGITANIVTGAAPGQVRITGLTGMTPNSVGHFLVLSNTFSIQNDGGFEIIVYNSASSVDVANPNAIAPDLNNGSIEWVEQSRQVTVKRGTVVTTSNGGKDFLTQNDVVFGVDDVWSGGIQDEIQRWIGAPWNITPVNATFTIRSIYGFGTSDVWAVGSSDPSNATGVPGVALHWDGFTWSSVPLPSGAQDFYGVWGASTNDVWAVGNQTVLHWNGISWSAISVPSPANTWHSVWGTGTSDVWAVGNNSGTMHWNGSVWTNVSNGGAIDTFFSVYGVATNDIWTVGSAGLGIHWNGTAWGSPVTIDGGGHNLLGVWGDTTSHFLAVGAGPVIYVWNGSTWTLQSSPATSDLQAVWGNGAGEIWTVGLSGTLMEWTGAVWVNIPSAVSTDLLTVWGSNQGITGPFTVPVKAISWGYEWNVTGQVTAADGEILPGEIDTMKTLVEVPEVLDTSIQVMQLLSTSGGRDAALDALGADRGISRLFGESDDAYRNRVRTLPDTISPDAFNRTISALLQPVMGSFTFIETFDIEYQTCYDAPRSIPVTGTGFDTNLFSYDDPRPAIPFKNRWLDYGDYRGGVIVVVNDIQPLQDTGMIWSPIPTTFAPISGQNGIAASIVTGAAAGNVRVTGLTGMTSSSVGHFLTISAAGSTGNDGSFLIIQFNSSASVDIINSNAVAPDANNGAIAWVEEIRNPDFPNASSLVSPISGGTRACDAFDVPNNLGFGYLQGAYDGSDLLKQALFKGIFDSLQNIKPAGATVAVELAGQ